MTIFSGKHVTELVMEWKACKDPEIMDKIIANTMPLAEYIARRYDSSRIDDMTQEAMIKIARSLEFYDPEIANCHTYFSTVIRNACITFVRREQKHECLDIDDSEYDVVTSDVIDNSSELEELIIRNRGRFESIPVETIDSASELIYNSMTSLDGQQRQVVGLLTKQLSIPRSVAMVIYNSTIVYLRGKHYNEAYREALVDELSIGPELRDFLGDDAYIKFMIVFSGMNFHI